MDKRTDLVLPLVIVTLGIAIIVVAAMTIQEVAIVADPVGPKGVAYLVGGACVIGGITIFAAQTRAWRKDVPPSEGSSDEPGYPSSAKRAFVVMGLSLLYVAVMPFITYLVATPFYLAATIRTLGGSSRSRLVFYPLAYTAVTYLAFVVGLDVDLP